jgi:O-antigen/teichoic acid export membrane protein
MILKKTIIFNCLAQIYTALIGLVFAPVYLKELGGEAYGLISIYSLLQASFNLFDLGAAPALSRETTQYLSKATSFSRLNQVFVYLNSYAILVTVIGSIFLLIMSEILTDKWLNVSPGFRSDAVVSLQLISITVACRWFSGVYRSIITGAEAFDWISALNILIGTMRFGLPILTMEIIGYSPVIFFSHQLVVAFIEILILFRKTKIVLPNLSMTTMRLKGVVESLKSIYPFSISVGLTSIIWFFVSQIDKIILSKILSLTEYGVVSTGIALAAAIGLIASPLTSVLTPALTRLYSTGAEEKMYELYNKSSEYVSVIVSPITSVMMWFSYPIVYLWTGDKSISITVSNVLTLYAFGNGILVLNAFPFYLQCAIGNVEKHLVGQILMVSILVPTVLALSTLYGGTGAGYAWAIANGSYFCFWVAYTHIRLKQKLHFKWLKTHVLPPIVISHLIGITIKIIDQPVENRYSAVKILLTTGFFCTIGSIGVSKNSRASLIHLLSRFRSVSI